MVGRGDLLQGLALMSLLAARRLVRWSAQALGPGGARRFFEPVARRRLATVRTVQPEPPLKLGDPRVQSRDLRRLRRDQRNQLFTRRLALRIRIRTHRILESKADSAVEKNLPAQPPRHATINLGSYHRPSPAPLWSSRGHRGSGSRQGADRPAQPGPRTALDDALPGAVTGCD